MCPTQGFYSSRVTLSAGILVFEDVRGLGKCRLSRMGMDRFYVLRFQRSLTTATLGGSDWTLAFSHRVFSVRPDLFYIGI